MKKAESIAWLENAFSSVRSTAASWAMSGWPDIANSHRRDARRLQRMIARIKCRERLIEA